VGIQFLSTSVNIGQVAAAGVLSQNQSTGGTEMGNTKLQAPSKRVRIVLCMLVTLAVTASVPASAFAAEWTWGAARVAAN
jgi:hypothetical protein